MENNFRCPHVNEMHSNGSACMKFPPKHKSIHTTHNVINQYTNLLKKMDSKVKYKIDSTNVIFSYSHKHLGELDTS